MYPNYADKSILQAVARRRERSGRLSRLAAERGETYFAVDSESEVALQEEHDPDEQEQSVSSSVEVPIEQPAENPEVVAEAIAEEDGSCVSSESIGNKETIGKVVQQVEEPSLNAAASLESESDNDLEIESADSDLEDHPKQSLSDSVYDLEDERDDLASISTIIDFDTLPKSEPRRVNKKATELESLDGEEIVKSTKNSQKRPISAKNPGSGGSKKKATLLDSYFKDL